MARIANASTFGATGRRDAGRQPIRPATGPAGSAEHDLGLPEGLRPAIGYLGHGPASWDHRATPPGPRSSIISAVKSLVSSADGAVEEAIILRGGHYAHGDDHRHGFSDQDTELMEDREKSAIEGLPPEDQPAALASLNDEIKFQKDVRAAPRISGCR